MKSSDEEFEKLLLAGGIQVAGVSDKGEILYQFTSKLKNINKQLFDEHLNYVNSQIMKLWEGGFVDLDLFAKEPVVTLTRKAFMPDDILTLSPEQRWSLEEIKRVLKEKEI